MNVKEAEVIPLVKAYEKMLDILISLKDHDCDVWFFKKILADYRKGVVRGE